MCRSSVDVTSRGCWIQTTGGCWAERGVRGADVRPEKPVIDSTPAQVDPVDRDAIRRQGFAVTVGDFEDERSA